MARNQSRIFSSFAILLILLLGGCRPAQVDRDQVAEAGDALQQATDAHASKDYPAAIEKLTAALDSGLLRPDGLCTALLLRAECYARNGKYQDALADLDRAEQGAPMD